MNKQEKMQLLTELVMMYVDHGPEKYTATQVSEKLYELSGIQFSPNIIGQVLQFQGYPKCGIQRVVSKKSKHYVTHLYSLKIGSKETEYKIDDYVIQFGKYCGYRLSEVNDAGYLSWVRNTIKLSDNVIQKIDSRILELRKPISPFIAIKPELNLINN
jgi:hypothetical protein